MYTARRNKNRNFPARAAAYSILFPVEILLIFWGVFFPYFYVLKNFAKN